MFNLCYSPSPYMIILQCHVNICMDEKDGCMGSQLSVNYNKIIIIKAIMPTYHSVTVCTV